MRWIFQIGLLLIPVLISAQTPTGSISGRIVTVNGDAAVDFRVAAITAPERAGTDTAAMTILALAKSDATGRYRLDDVPPGRYLIAAGPLDSAAYYPGVFTPEEATIVTVPAGGALASLNFSMPPRVSGRLQSPSGVKTAEVSLRLSDASTGAQIETTTASDGSFLFTAVRPGTYALTARDRILSEPTTLSVKDQDVTGLEFALLNRLPVEGSLVVEGGGPRPRVTLSLVPVKTHVCPWLNVPVRSTPDGANGCVVPAPMEAYGVLWFLVEGDYRVSLSALPSGYFLKSLVSGDVDLVKQPFHAGIVKPIVVTLGVASPPPWVRVRGRMRDESGAPQIAKPSRLSLLPVRSEASPLADFLDPFTTNVQADGSFEFPMVPSGVYEMHLGKLPVRALSLTVTDRDVDGLDIVIPPLKEVSGQFSIDGVKERLEEAPSPMTFQLTDITTAETVLFETRPGCDQRFKAVFPEGDFRLTVFMPGFPVKAVTYGGTDVLQNPLHIASGDHEEMRMLLAPGRTPLSGEQAVRVCLWEGILPPPSPLPPGGTLPQFRN